MGGFVVVLSCAAACGSELLCRNEEEAKVEKAQGLQDEAGGGEV